MPFLYPSIYLFYKHALLDLIDERTIARKSLILKEKGDFRY